MPAMLTTTKIRTAIAVTVVGAALASSGVASAATVSQPGSTTTVAATPPSPTVPMVEYVVLVGALKSLLESIAP
jgi:hypothetical protein